MRQRYFCLASLLMLLVLGTGSLRLCAQSGNAEELLKQMLTKSDGRLALEARTNPDDSGSAINEDKGSYTYYEDCQKFYICVAFKSSSGRSLVVSRADMVRVSDRNGFFFLNASDIDESLSSILSPEGSIVLNNYMVGTEALEYFFKQYLKFRHGYCNSPHQVSPGVYCHSSHPHLGTTVPDSGTSCTFSVAVSRPRSQTVGLEFDSTAGPPIKILSFSSADLGPIMSAYQRQASTISEGDAPETEDEIIAPAAFFDGLAYLSQAPTTVGTVKVEPWDPDVLTYLINLKDRTPPVVQFAPMVGDASHFTMAGKWPVMCQENGVKATTGDNCAMNGLRVTDNSNKPCWIWFAIGILTGQPAASADWQDHEQWQLCGDEPTKLANGDYAKAVFIPNTVEGFMRYSLFAWDTDKEHGNLNPGDPGIQDNNNPLNCYGLNPDYPRHPLQDQSIGVNGGLGVAHGLTAEQMEFPYTIGTYPGSIQDLHARPSDYLNLDAAGLIRIRDNDRPNLMLRVCSMRDKETVMQQKIFIPPPSEIGASFTTDDAHYPGFVSGAKFVDEGDAVVNKFEILDIDLTDVYGDGSQPNIDPSEWRAKYNHTQNANHGFLNKNFRLEDFSCSDTGLEGELITGQEDTFGRRHGYGVSAVVLCLEPLIEDIEYEVQFWAEDNVKYVGQAPPSYSLPSGVTSPALSFPTPPSGSHSGIAAGQIQVFIPNQYPPVNATHTLQSHEIYEFTSPSISVVFREPTLLPGEPGFDVNKLPFIYAKVQDMRGLTRELKVYFIVRDEKTQVRIIERQHQKR